MPRAAPIHEEKCCHTPLHRPHRGHAPLRRHLHPYVVLYELRHRPLQFGEPIHRGVLLRAPAPQGRYLRLYPYRRRRQPGHPHLHMNELHAAFPLHLVRQSGQLAYCRFRHIYDAHCRQMPFDYRPWHGGCCSSIHWGLPWLILFLFASQLYAFYPFRALKGLAFLRGLKINSNSILLCSKLLLTLPLPAVPLPSRAIWSRNKLFVMGCGLSRGALG